jgi:uncharacterized paraquat-inducible protein A
MSSTQKILTLLIIFVALGLLYPGVTQPVLTLSGTIEKSELAELGIEMIAGEGADAQTRQMLTMISSFLGFDQIEGQLQAYSSTRSMWGTVEELARTGNVLVAFLIVFFSLVIPVFKLLLQALTLFVSAPDARKHLLWLNAALSKWSMSDVFVMGLLVAFMAGRASDQVGDLLIMNAELEPGFYYFLAYCLFSIAASALLRSDKVVTAHA